MVDRQYDPEFIIEVAGLLQNDTLDLLPVPLPQHFHTQGVFNADPKCAKNKTEMHRVKVPRVQR